MSRSRKKLFVLSLMLFLTCFSIVAVRSVTASETLVWEGQVPSSGAPITSAELESGVQYRIVASDMWWYNKPGNLAADAQYYTTDWSNSWDWTNYFHAPDGHSFLQINSQDVDWGAFSNGDTGHTYTKYYNGTGSAIVFRIYDWMDPSTNNECKLLVRIYRDITVGGYVLDTNPLGNVAFLMINALMLVAVVAFPFLKQCRKASRIER